MRAIARWLVKSAMQTAILTFITPVISMIFTFVFLALWWNDRAQRPVLAFAACFGLLAIGVSINIWLLQAMNSSLGFVAYHVVSMGAMLSLLWGIAKRAEVKVPIGFFTATIVPVCFLIWLSIELGQKDAMRLVQNTHSAAAFVLIAMSLFYGTRRNLADTALMWVIVTLSVFSFVKPSLTFLVLSGPMERETAMAVLSAFHILFLATLLTLIALCLIASIITDRLEETKEVAAQDALTGLPTRGAFELLARQMLARAASERILVSLIVGDIDHFKRINDTFGHTVGDRVITRFGEVIGERIRPGDVAGRIGGEEFCIVAWNCSEKGAFALAERLRAGFERIEHSDLPHWEKVSASFGVAEVRPGSDYTQTFKRADEALYRAKRGGRNRVMSDTFDHLGGRPDEELDCDEIDAAASSVNGAQIVRLSERQASRSS